MSWLKSQNLWVGIKVFLVLLIICGICKLIPNKAVGPYGPSKRHVTETRIAMVETELQLFLLENGRYPTQEEGLMALVVEPNHVMGWKEAVMALKVEPNDVKGWRGKPDIRRDRQLFDAWGNLLIYRIPAEWSDEEYDVISYGADGKPGGEGEDEDIYNRD